jgi:BirA family biotin operon repressor/biotin-[acetyl-CoA-carboxylase] ligase
LLWAAAIAEVLDCRLKWPNDLQDRQGLKLGGLLAELVAPSASLPQDWQVVLGIGINVNQLEFSHLPEATSLRRIRGSVQDRGVLLNKLVDAIEAVDPMGPEGLDRWRQRANTLGRRVRVGQIEGVAQDIREDGALVIDGQPVLAGDVQMVSSAKPGTEC